MNLENVGCGLYSDTQILIANGDIKCAKDIITGDLLIGPDSLCKKVLATYIGEDDMYQIIPNKGNPFICSGSFRLTLKGLVPYLQPRKDRDNRPEIRYTQQGNSKK